MLIRGFPNPYRRSGGWRVGEPAVAVPVAEGGADHLPLLLSAETLEKKSSAYLSLRLRARMHLVERGEIPGTVPRLIHPLMIHVAHCQDCTRHLLI